MNKEKLLKIGELAEKTGVTLRTIRYYDELGLIKPEKRSSGNFRLYNKNAVALINLISSLKQLDFSLEEIKGMLLNPDTSQKDYISVINRTKNILLKKKEKVTEKINYYKDLSDEIDNSIRIIEECIECRKDRGKDAPCKPGCQNSSIHIKT